MAKMSAKGAIITVDDSAGTPRNISTDVKSFSFELNSAPVDITGFVEAVSNFTPGLKSASITLDLFWNTAATTGSLTVLYGILGSTTSKTVSIQPEGSGLTLSGEFMLENISPAGTPADSIGLGSCKFSLMGSTFPTIA